MEQNDLSQAKSKGGLSLENVQDGRYDELQVKKVLREDVGKRNGGLNEPSKQ